MADKNGKEWSLCLLFIVLFAICYTKQKKIELFKLSWRGSPREGTGLIRNGLITTAQDYLDGFMEESKEELDTDESLSGEDSDSLTENEECGD